MTSFPAHPASARDKRPSRALSITGWVITVLVGAFLLFSGVSKFSDFPGKGEMMAKLGIPLSLLPTIAIIELGVVILLLIPRTAFLGAILATGYLGGAVFTHLRIADPLPSVLFPAILGIALWVGLALRRPTIFRLALGARESAEGMLP